VREHSRYLLCVSTADLLKHSGEAVALLRLQFRHFIATRGTPQDPVSCRRNQNVHVQGVSTSQLSLHCSVLRAAWQYACCRLGVP